MILQVKFRPAIWSLLVFIVSIVITQSIAYGIFTTEKEREQLEVIREVENKKSRLEQALNHSITATEMVAFLVEKDLIGTDFDTIAAELLGRNEFIDALQLVKGKEIIKTFPLEGNEPAIGYAIMEVPHHRKSALTSIERNELYFEGPFQLKQGGVGVVGRLPIYKDAQYWGFSAVIIRIETFHAALGIDSTGADSHYVYQLVKERKGEEPVPFFDNHAYQSGIFSSAKVHSGDWKIYGKLKASTHFAKTWPFALLGLIFSLLLTGFTWFITNEPRKLSVMVDEKTKSLDALNLTLQKNTRDLEISNRELEQYAYIASHDLQEPLRMVTSFVRLLKKKYGDQLDENAHRYMAFAEDGAVRMQQNILDLLEYARVGNHRGEKSTIDLNQLLREYQLDREQIISEKSVTIVAQDLPVIHQNKVPVVQLFYNLIDNAIKYAHPDRTPEITISAVDKGTEWQFTVSDNGIGIASEYFDKIFVLFQRLHAREEYNGTGIGLSIVQRVLENMGGQIRVESELNKGSAFIFAIPK